MSKRSRNWLLPGGLPVNHYAWVLFRNAKYAEARVSGSKALAAGPPDSVVVEHYGDILFELGDIPVKIVGTRPHLGGGSALLERKMRRRGARGVDATA
ncbi:MAG: hypothetical protein R2818_07765 [Flavobacteriales bacterium]